MSITKPTLLILAAGMGSRYGSLKQVDKLGPSGETIIDYSVYDAKRAGFGKVVFVIRKSIEAEFKEAYSKLEKQIAVDYVFQELDNVPAGITVPADRQKPWGTAHAIMVAADAIKEPFAVINADDFYGATSFKNMADYLSTPRADEHETYSMVGFILKNTLSEHGFVSRGVCGTNKDGFLTDVVERTSIQRMENQQIMFKDSDESLKPLTGEEIVSMNFWGFPASVFSHLKRFFTEFIQQNAGNIKSEFYIPIAINLLTKENQAKVKVLDTPDQWFGVTYKEDKESTIQRIKNLIAAGKYPAKLW